MAASFDIKAFLAIVLVFLPIAAKGDFGDHGMPPVNSPFLDNICNGVNCGRGKCEAAPGSPFNFKCKCDPGWEQTRFDDDDKNDNNEFVDKLDDLEFLPCVIPNCSLNYSCMPAAPPAPATPRNLSVFDPCNWVYCGEGTCVKNGTNTHSHTCACRPGYESLLNTSAFPCYNQCALGANCQDLGISVTRSASTPSANDNQATSFLPGKFHWIAIMLISATMAM